MPALSSRLGLEKVGEDSVKDCRVSDLSSPFSGVKTDFDNVLMKQVNAGFRYQRIISGTCHVAINPAKFVVVWPEQFLTEGSS